MSEKIKSEEELNDDFLSGLEAVAPEDLATPASVNEVEMAKRNQMKVQLDQAKRTNSKKEEALKKIEENATFEETMESHKPSQKEDHYVIENLVDQEAETQATVEEPVKEEVPIVEELVEEKGPVVEEVKPKTTKKTTKPKVEKKIDVISSEEAAAIESKTNNKNKIGKDIDSDDLDQRVFDENYENDVETVKNVEDEDYIRADNVDEIIETINNNYEDDSTESAENIDVKVVEDSVKPKEAEAETEVSKSTKEKKKSNFHGGDGEETSFKLRTAKIAKVLRNINIENTDEIDVKDISSKSPAERQKFYLNTVLPTLQPSIAVVPLIISGVVITMSAWSWPDVKEVVELEEHVFDLDPNAPEYIHEKNRVFIEKRRKQCELFYKHINSVSGYVVKPSIEELFGNIIKMPDIQQLFFAAYAASFNKPYEFDITCGNCGSTTPMSIYSKQLCFLLNKNIDIKRLNYFIENGSAIGSDETTKIYNEFQKEKIVEMSNTTYRIKKNLPISSFIYNLKIPTIYGYLDKLESINEVFRNKDFSYTNPNTLETVYIDSSFGLSPSLIEIRKYLYLESLCAAGMVSEDKENNSAKVAYSSYKDDSAIINSVYNLSYEDYNALIKDENLSKLIRIDGIRHAVDGGICSEPSCKADIGKIPIEPEQLFFTIAHQEK